MTDQSYTTSVNISACTHHSTFESASSTTGCSTLVHPRCALNAAFDLPSSSTRARTHGSKIEQNSLGPLIQVFATENNTWYGVASQIFTTNFRISTCAHYSAFEYTLQLFLKLLLQASSKREAYCKNKTCCTK